MVSENRNVKSLETAGLLPVLTTDPFKLIADEFTEVAQSRAEDGSIYPQEHLDKVAGLFYESTRREPTEFELLGMQAFALVLEAATRIDRGDEGKLYQQLNRVGPLNGPLVAARALDHAVRAIKKEAIVGAVDSHRQALLDLAKPGNLLQEMAAMPNGFNKHYEQAMGLEAVSYVSPYYQPLIFGQKAGEWSLYENPNYHLAAIEYAELESGLTYGDFGEGAGSCPARSKLLPVIWQWMVTSYLAD